MGTSGLSEKWTRSGDRWRRCKSASARSRVSGSPRKSHDGNLTIRRHRVLTVARRERHDPRPGALALLAFERLRRDREVPAIDVDRDVVRTPREIHVPAGM